ncbi:MAG: histidine phosphatase family protein [Myxococcales bacterium]|nr:histidine phosphatase family protein [Myxococcales bacterium]
MHELDAEPRVFAAILRHGEYEQPADTPSAHLPYPLTPRGEAQARAAADQLFELIGQVAAAEPTARRVRIDGTIHTSRMLRAWQTGVLLAERLTARLRQSFVVSEHEALAERSLGAAANLTVAAIEAALARDPRARAPAPGWKSTPHYRLPLTGAETLMEAGERVARFIQAELDALARRASDDSLMIFVGHGGAFRHAAAHLGILELDQVRGLSMHHARPILLERRPDSRLDRIAGEWKIRSKPSR